VDQAADIQELTRVLRDLLGRVYRIEQQLGMVEDRPAAAPSMTTVPAVISAPVNESAPPAPPVTPAIIAEPATHSRAPRSESLPGPSLESRIGSHWANRIGITAMLIGVAYFLKYAFESNWIGPAGRVSIGLVAGIAVVVWSEWFRAREYRAFSHSLKAVGIGVLYLSVWAAFQVYSLIPVTIAFMAMVVVTVSTAIMALSEDAEVLAAFAVAGGLITPALLSTGQNREVALFSYVALIDFSTLVLASLRPWRRVLALAFVGTLGLYAAWYVAFYARLELRTTLGFATLLFAIFVVAPLSGRTRRAEAAGSSTFSMTLALVNAGVYFLQVYVLLNDVSKTAAAWFALALAAVYLMLSRRAGRDHGVDAARRLNLLHLALAVGFVTVAIPIRLEAHWVTIGWFVEAGVLLWVSQRIKSDFLAIFSIAALALGIARLLLFDNFRAEHAVWNARLATFAVAVAVLAAVAWYADRRGDLRGRTVMQVAVVAMNVLALIGLSREVADYFSRQLLVAMPQGRSSGWSPEIWSRYKNVGIARAFAYSALWMTYGAMLMIAGFWKKSAFVRWQALTLIAVTTLKVFVYDVSELERVYRIVSFIVLGLLLLAISFAYQRDWLRLSRRVSSGAGESQDA
jgi:uncharacterized membrane protein